MSETAENIDKKVLDNCIIYRRNGIIKVINPPRYGEVILKFQDDRLTLINKSESEKV